MQREAKARVEDEHRIFLGIGMLNRDDRYRDTANGVGVADMRDGNNHSFQIEIDFACVLECGIYLPPWHQRKGWHGMFREIS